MGRLFHPRVTRRSLAEVGCLLAVAMVLAACGESTEKSATTTNPVGSPVTTAATSLPPAQGSNPAGACRLVTSAEVTQAVGAPIGTPEIKAIRQEEGLMLELCNFPRANGGVGASVGIYGHSGGITSALFNQFRQAKTSHGNVKAVGGVGDEAFEIAGIPRQIIFRKGSKAALVLAWLTDTNTEQRVFDLSKAAAGRL